MFARPPSSDDLAGGFLGYMLLQNAGDLRGVRRRSAICAGALFRLDDLLTFCAAVLALGVLGYLLVLARLANYAVFGVVKIVVLAALLVRFGVDRLAAPDRRLSLARRAVAVRHAVLPSSF